MSLRCMTYDVGAYRYGYNGMEKDDEAKGNGNSYTTEFRQYDPRIGRWLSLDPKMLEFPQWSPYVAFNDNPIMYVDIAGDIPSPVMKKWKNAGWKLTSGFGKRPPSKENPKASTDHMGADINSVLGGDSDIGAPVLATHDGVATIDDNPNGGQGRSITITSPDGKFRTRYFHLESISIKNGEVTEAFQIGTVGKSQFGKQRNNKIFAHLHYEIEILINGVWENIDPQLDSDNNARTNNNMENLVDPQMWVDGRLELGTKTRTIVKELNEVKVFGKRADIQINKLTPLPIQLITNFNMGSTNHINTIGSSDSNFTHRPKMDSFNSGKSTFNSQKFVETYDKKY